MSQCKHDAAERERADANALTLGDFGERVVWVQRALERFRRGRYPELLPLKADGFFDCQTRTAVEQYQSLTGLPATGVVDSECLESLRKDMKNLPQTSGEEMPPMGRTMKRPGVDDWPGCTLHPGCRGAEVVLLQQRLRTAAGQYVQLEPPPVCGLYETRTEHAVRWVQRQFGLREDGAVDRETWILIAGISGS